MPAVLVFCALVFSFILAPAARAQERPVMNAHFSEWDARAPAHTDPSGDAGSTGADFGRMWIENDAEWLYIRFETGRDILLQEKNGLRLWIDTDCSAATGVRNGDLGSELVWRFGDRAGTAALGGSSVNIKHADIGLVPAPSVVSHDFEIAVRRSAHPGGHTLFAGPCIRIALSDVGDRQPDGAGYVEYTFHSDTFDPVPALSIDPVPGTLRLLSWNTKNDGMFDAVRAPAFSRILHAVSPDVMIFCEVFDHTAEDVRTFVASALSPPPGSTWTARKLDAGNVLVTHLSVEASALVQANYRESAFLLRRPDGGHLLVIAMHLRCCSADDDRQREADGLVAFLRDLQKGIGSFSLPSGTPVVLAGDFNLVGDPRQLVTLATGAIVDTMRYGSSAGPDNGRPLEILGARSPRSLFPQTWENLTGTYAPGVLDYVLYSGSSLTVPHALVLRTEELTPNELAAAGLLASDARTASDHFPRISDLLPSPQTTVAPPRGSTATEPNVWPNPAWTNGTLHVALSERTGARICVTDLLGREVLQKVLEPGIRSADLPLGALHPGAYVVSLHTSSAVRSHVIVVRAW